MRLNGLLIAFLFSFFFIIFSAGNLLAQDNISDTAFYQKALVNASAVYHQSFGSQSALYNGNKYSQYPYKFKGGHQFFHSIEPVIGAVVYDGIRYDSILMQYDEISDVLVILGPRNWIQLLNGRVERFNLYNSNFVWLEKDSMRNTLDRTGFYNVLYTGQTSLLKKQIKLSREEISSNLEVLHFADEKDHYYIVQHNTYYPVKRKKDLYKIFGDQKKAVQRFVKTNHLNFRKNREAMLTAATAYYDNLKK